MIEIVARSSEGEDAAGVRGTDGIRQTDVCDPGIDEHFRLAHLGAAHPDGAAFDLPFAR